MKIIEETSWAKLAVGLLAVTLVSAACTGDDDDDSPELVEGTYTFTAANVPIDQCWPSDTNADPAVVGVPVPLVVSALNTSAQEFVLESSGAVGTFLVPGPEAGEYDGEDVSSHMFGTGLTVHLTTSCSILITGNMAGDILDDGSLELTLFTGFALATLNSAGTAAPDCTTHPADIMGGFVPFPAVLTSAGDPACGASATGIATPP